MTAEHLDMAWILEPESLSGVTNLEGREGDIK